MRRLLLLAILLGACLETRKLMNKDLETRFGEIENDSSCVKTSTP